MYQSQSIAIVLLMLLGVYFRHQRYIHVKFMSVVIIWDFLLILQIELARGAIEKAGQMMKNAIILNIHVTLACTTVVFYGLMIYTGRKILKGPVSVVLKRYHGILGRMTLVLRMLTFFTSFFVVK